jgi:hypothetical protein
VLQTDRSGRFMNSLGSTGSVESRLVPVSGCIYDSCRSPTANPGSTATFATAKTWPKSERSDWASCVVADLSALLTCVPKEHRINTIPLPSFTGQLPARSTLRLSMMTG